MIMLRAGRFRHRLLDEAFLDSKSDLAFSCLEKFIALWRQKRLTDAEITGVYIFIFAFLRRPKDFLGGVHQQAIDSFVLPQPISGQEVIRLIKEELPPDLASAKSLDRLNNQNPFLENFCRLSWRSIPLSVSQSLMAWQSGRYPLHLLTTVPSPKDVLHMQAQGLRCVSMLHQKNEIQNFVEEGRDVFGFIVHDLIHADHFFADPHKAQAQILFSQKLVQVLEFPQIQMMITKDPVFESEFHYLMSDMNSVPLHLLKTLKAILLGYYKRRAGLPMGHTLPKELELEFSLLLETSLAPWNLSVEALAAAHRLNTQDYRGLADAALLHHSLATNCYTSSPVFC